MPERDRLRHLLKCLQPELMQRAFVFCCLTEKIWGESTGLAEGMVREREGISVIVEQAIAQEHGWPFQGVWAKITLTVQSELADIGFLAVVAERLARAGISVNPLAGCYHDHLFVPWEKREAALAVLRQLEDHERGSSGSGSAPGAGTP
jgi:hypothetical protein